MVEKQSPQYVHNLIAGILPNDKSIELFADRTTRKVHYMQNGRVRSFQELPHNIRIQLEKWLVKDKKAKEDLSGLAWSEALEEYSFCLFGAADNEADFCKEGKIQKPDNFRCGENCRCLKWESKNISYEGANLTLREIQIVDLLKTGLPDKAIAYKLGIKESTLNTQKKALMLKLGAQNKTEVVFKASINKIIQ